MTGGDQSMALISANDAALFQTVVEHRLGLQPAESILLPFEKQSDVITLNGFLEPRREKLAAATNVHVIRIQHINGCAFLSLPEVLVYNAVMYALILRFPQGDLLDRSNHRRSSFTVVSPLSGVPTCP